MRRSVDAPLVSLVSARKRSTPSFPCKSIRSFEPVFWTGYFVSRFWGVISTDRLYPFHDSFDLSIEPPTDSQDNAFETRLGNLVRPVAAWASELRA